MIPCVRMAKQYASTGTRSIDNVEASTAFFNMYHHGFIRTAVGVPEVRVADPAYNAAQTVDLLRQAVAQHAVLAVFPELGLSSYTCDDLFHQQALLDASLSALNTVREASVDLPIVAVVGMPLEIDQQLFNCAVVLHQGRILGVVPKTFLPGYREFYEVRQFAPAANAHRDAISLCGQNHIPFGEKLLFDIAGTPSWTFFVEICEDLWVPIPPSSYAALAGATVLLNLSASNVTIAKDAYRHSLVSNQSARCLAAYLYTAAGAGESTTDLAWDGHALVYENGTLVAESERFQPTSQLITADLDLDRLIQERVRMTTFGQSMQHYRHELTAFRRIAVPLAVPTARRIMPSRSYDRFPYVPSDPSLRDRRCYEAYNIQVQGLAKRLQSAGIEEVVIGISGGLDSTHALIVSARAMDLLGYPRTNILAYTMPGFATSDRTLANAHQLMRAVGCKAHELDIRPSCEQMLRCHIRGQITPMSRSKCGRAGRAISSASPITAGPGMAPATRRLALGWHQGWVTTGVRRAQTLFSFSHGGHRSPPRSGEISWPLSSVRNWCRAPLTAINPVKKPRRWLGLTGL